MKNLSFLRLISFLKRVIAQLKKPSVIRMVKKSTIGSMEGYLGTHNSIELYNFDFDPVLIALYGLGIILLILQVFFPSIFSPEKKWSFLLQRLGGIVISAFILGYHYYICDQFPPEKVFSFIIELLSVNIHHLIV